MLLKTETKVGAFILIAFCVFFYMSFYLSMFRLDRLQYNKYTVFFDDISGLEKKAEVKIAGVKVGWVDSLELIDGKYRAKAIIMINKKYELRKNAYAIARQEGLLGSKYLEIVPGDPYMPVLHPSEPLTKPGRPPANIDDILHKTQEIAIHIEDVTGSMQDAFGGYQGTQKLKEVFDNLHQTSERMATFTGTLDRVISHNEQIIDAAITDFRDLIPSLKISIDKMADVLDRDFNRIAGNIEATTTSLESAAQQASEGFKSIGSVANKIDAGEGFIGKLMNDEDTYRDFSLAVKGFKKYMHRMDMLGIVFDSHGEFMLRHAENVTFKDTKGYVDIRLHTSEDYFFIGQLVSSQKGILRRSINDRLWFDERGTMLLPSQLLEDKIAIPQLVGRWETTKRRLDQFKFGFQFGKMYKDLAFRFGLFESSAGFAVDVNIPFETDKFRWISSFEIFDFRGRDRIDDSRPHLKWINRVFLMRNLYMSFGADDFISRQNANAFFGGGVRFSDDDIKYLLGMVGLAGLAS